MMAGADILPDTHVLRQIKDLVAAQVDRETDFTLHGGLMGQTIFLFEYAAFFDDNEIRMLVENCMDRLLQHEWDCGFSFGNGMTGVATACKHITCKGWAAADINGLFSPLDDLCRRRLLQNSRYTIDALYDQISCGYYLYSNGLLTADAAAASALYYRRFFFTALKSVNASGQLMVFDPIMAGIGFLPVLVEQEGIPELIADLADRLLHFLDIRQNSPGLNTLKLLYVLRRLAVQIEDNWFIERVNSYENYFFSYLNQHAGKFLLPRELSVNKGLPGIHFFNGLFPGFSSNEVSCINKQEMLRRIARDMAEVNDFSLLNGLSGTGLSMLCDAGNASSFSVLKKMLLYC